MGGGPGCDGNERGTRGGPGCDGNERGTGGGLGCDGNEKWGGGGHEWRVWCAQTFSDTGVRRLFRTQTEVVFVRGQD